LKTTDNALLMDAIREDASMEYRNRIPAATDAGVTQAVAELWKHHSHRNEFIDAFVNRIGLVLMRNMSWTNPLAVFKRGLLEFGDTIEEVQTGLLEAHTYDPDRESTERDLFGTERPRVESSFHTINRQNFYKVTVNLTLLKRAFIEPGGLAKYAAQLMTTPSTSDQWDEFLLMASLFRQYDKNGGFFNVNVPDISRLESNPADARLALRRMRSTALTLKFPSEKYNPAGMPTFANPQDLLLFGTPDFIAAVDVEALAGAFNVQKTDMPARMIPLPESAIGIDGAQAIMTTRDFFVVADTLFETTSQWNPVSLQNNYFLHHHQIISASRFVPAVMFSTNADTEVINLTSSVTSVSAPTIEPIDGDAVTEVTRGSMIALHADVNDDPDGSAPNVGWSVSGNTSQQTYITQSGVLHCGIDEGAANLTVTAWSTFIDPENTRNDPKTASVTVPVVGAGKNWPRNAEGITGIRIAGEDVTGVNSATTSYTLALPADTTVAKKDVVVTSDGPADADVTVTKVTGGYTVTVSYDPGVGAPVVYTVNVTVG
jgi:hypothetical protein